MASPTSEKEWADRARRYFKAQLKKAGMTYAELASRLEAQGFRETEASITSKLGRGTFAATFFLAAMKAIEVEQIRLHDF